MRIVELTAYHVGIPLKKKIEHASHSRAQNDTLIVRCRLDNGLEGWGEGLPRPYVTGETIETASRQFSETDWPAQLGGAIDDLTGAIALRLTLPSFSFSINSNSWKRVPTGMMSLPPAAS